MADIKILVSNRIDLKSAQFNSNILVPVRCGAVYDDTKDAAVLGDNTGDNISERRYTFCEQTVQYWAWKNVQADYYGLFHYRRFFSFNPHHFQEDAWGTVTETFIDEAAARTYAIKDEVMEKLITQYDLILPEVKNVTSFPGRPKSVWDHWCKAQNLHENDLNIMMSVISDLQPDYLEDAKKYMYGKSGYFCGMHIMKKELFFDYCEWLYPILFELEKRIDIKEYSIEGQRTVGHLAERLLGIFATHMKRVHPDLKVKELQTVLFMNPKSHETCLHPAFEDLEKTIPIVFSSSDAFASPCSVAINSIIQNSSADRKYDIIILETTISANKKRLLNSLICSKDNFSIRYFNVQSIIQNYHLVANDHISIETFYRFLIQEILPDYDKVLYLDGDLVCNRDVAELYDTDIGDNLVGAVVDPDMNGQINLPNSDRYRYLTREVCLEAPYTYFQAGVLLLNTREMRKLYTMNEWLSFAQHRYDYSDQDVLNRYCQGRVFYLDMAWNTLTDCNNYRVPVIIRQAIGSVSEAYGKARTNPFIVHFAGFEKPWKQRGVDMEDYFWKYARNTPFYEEFIVDIARNSENARQSGAVSQIGVRGALKNYVKKKADKWLPKGSRLRAIGNRVYHKLR